jgi:hypothetical protein
MSFATEFVGKIKPALFELENRKRAIGAQAYMKDIATFIGVTTPERRSLVKKIARELPKPSSFELGTTVRRLWIQEEREFQYAANDLIDIHIGVADKDFLAEHLAAKG